MFLFKRYSLSEIFEILKSYGYEFKDYVLKFCRGNFKIVFDFYDKEV